MKNKWKWLLIILIAIFLIKNIVHYGIIICQNHDFNQIFVFGSAMIVLGYLYIFFSKMFLNDNF